MRILVVKTSSLGDILHTFPILDYLREHLPHAEIDWVVERPFADLLQRHPRVKRTLVVDTKRWRKGRGWKEMGAFRRELRQERYDWVFDLQGNCKSGLITLLARGAEKVGFGRKSVPEWPNLVATRRRFNPPLGRNIREDYLHLVAKALDLPDKLPPSITRLTVSDRERAQVEAFLAHPKLQGEKILVCPGSAWPNKRLPLDTLVTFCSQTSARLTPDCDPSSSGRGRGWSEGTYPDEAGFVNPDEKGCALDDRLLSMPSGLGGAIRGFIWLWGNDEERGVAHQLLQNFGQTSLMAPKLSLPALQYLMGQVDLVVTMDSLPLHLAGLTETPTYSLFGPSLAAKYAPIGEQHTSLQGACPYGRTFTKRCPKLRSCPTGACMHGLQPSRFQPIQPPPKTRSPS